MSSEEFDDPVCEAAWLKEQRRVVQAYLDRQGAPHAGLVSEPAWFVAPYVSLWAILSRKRPVAIGWWAIAGDVPTDYLSSRDASNARTALRAFGSRWASAAAAMARGERPSGFTIGEPSRWPSLAPQLASRAELLARWADDEGIWS